MNKIYSSQLISFCIGYGVESAVAVTIIFAVSPSLKSPEPITYEMSTLHDAIDDMIASGVSLKDPVYRGRNVILSFMRERGYREIVVVR